MLYGIMTLMARLAAFAVIADKRGVPEPLKFDVTDCIDVPHGRLNLIMEVQLLSKTNATIDAAEMVNDFHRVKERYSDYARHAQNVFVTTTPAAGAVENHKGEDTGVGYYADYHVIVLEGTKSFATAAPGCKAAASDAELPDIGPPEARLALKLLLIRLGIDRVIVAHVANPGSGYFSIGGIPLLPYEGGIDVNTAGSKFEVINKLVFTKEGTMVKIPAADAAERVICLKPKEFSHIKSELPGAQILLGKIGDMFAKLTSFGDKFSKIVDSRAAVEASKFVSQQLAVKFPKNSLLDPIYRLLTHFDQAGEWVYMKSNKMRKLRLLLELGNKFLSSMRIKGEKIRLNSEETLTLHEQVPSIQAHSPVSLRVLNSNPSNREMNVVIQALARSPITVQILSIKPYILPAGTVIEDRFFMVTRGPNGKVTEVQTTPKMPELIGCLPGDQGGEGRVRTCEAVATTDAHSDCGIEVARREKPLRQGNACRASSLNRPIEMQSTCTGVKVLNVYRYTTLQTRCHGIPGEAELYPSTVRLDPNCTYLEGDREIATATLTGAEEAFTADEGVFDIIKLKEQTDSGFFETIVNITGDRFVANIVLFGSPVIAILTIAVTICLCVWNNKDPISFSRWTGRLSDIMCWSCHFCGCCLEELPDIAPPNDDQIPLRQVPTGRSGAVYVPEDRVGLRESLGDNRPASIASAPYRPQPSAQKRRAPPPPTRGGGGVITRSISNMEIARAEVYEPPLVRSQLALAQNGYESSDSSGREQRGNGFGTNSVRSKVSMNIGKRPKVKYTVVKSPSTAIVPYTPDYRRSGNSM